MMINNITKTIVCDRSDYEKIAAYTKRENIHIEVSTPLFGIGDYVVTCGIVAYDWIQNMLNDCNLHLKI